MLDFAFAQNFTIRLLVLLFLIYPMTGYPRKLGNEAVVHDVDFAMSLPVVQVLPNQYFEVELESTIVDSSMTWNVRSAKPLAAQNPLYVTGTFDGKFLYLPCVLHKGQAYKATLEALYDESGLKLQLQALSSNNDCLIIKPLTTENFTDSQCDDEALSYQVDELGLPQLQSYPHAKTSIYMDFTGGAFSGEIIPAFDVDEEPLPFAVSEQADIACTWKRTAEFFAMFDINVTTMKTVKDASQAWAWIVIGGNGSGFGWVKGLGQLNTFGTSAIPTAWASASSATIDSTYYNTIAHEAGHIFGLQHQGFYQDGKFEFMSSDGSYRTVKAIMSSGDSSTNTWRRGQFDRSSNQQDVQDDIELIRTKIMNFAGGDGWRHDDLSEDRNSSSAVLGQVGYGVIEKPGDKDVAAFEHPGGKLVVSVRSRGASSVDLTLGLYDTLGQVAIRQNATTYGREIIELGFLPAGRYYIEISSTAVATPYNTENLSVLGAYIAEIIPSDRAWLRAATFMDSRFAACVRDTAREWGWVFVADVKTLDCSYKRINLLGGVGQLFAITRLDVNGNYLTSLDLSLNKQLEELWVNENELASLDVSQSLGLKKLYLGGNNLTNLDVSKNPKLENLVVWENILTQLDVTKNPYLYQLNASGNDLRQIDLGHTPDLHWLYLDNNQLTELDLKANPEINSLDIKNNLLSAIDLTGNKHLTIIDVSHNRLTSISLPAELPDAYLNVTGNRLNQETVDYLREIPGIFSFMGEPQN